MLQDKCNNNDEFDTGYLLTLPNWNREVNFPLYNAMSRKIKIEFDIQGLTNFI